MMSKISLKLLVFVGFLFFLFIVQCQSDNVISGLTPVDPIKQQVDEEVSKILKISSGPKRIGGPGLGFGGPGIPGGWSKADIKSKEVIAIANYASEALFPGLHPSPRIISAMTQVVAGLNYNITAQITRLVKVGSISTTCSTHSVAVWDRFGTYQLMKNETLSTRCN